ncbi:MAG: hypothetical protein ACO2ZJ_08515, partial [Pseudohongiellaceae bacterium]
FSPAVAAKTIAPIIEPTYGKTVLEVEKRLVRLVPEEFLLDAHHWLILHGRYTCIARKPRCGSCLIEDLCEFKQKTDP